MEPQYTEPLPQCDGPKLKPFKLPMPNPEFHRLISDPDAEGQAYVFEASIRSTVYAIKVFKFYDVAWARAPLVGEEEDMVSDDLLEAHCDPFFRECRAYGRLEEKKLDGKVAARCYGYITIPSEKEKLFQSKFEIYDWDRPGVERSKPLSERQPLRAIVKELILKDVPLTGRVADRILRHMKRMRRCGIYSNDVFPRNYKDGLLVDMSLAMTEPFYLFEIWRGRRKMLKDKELYMWENMVKENHLDTRSRPFRNEEYCDKLRPRKAKTRLLEKRYPR